MISSLKLKFDIFNRRAVFLSADKLAVYHWHRGELGTSYLFDIDEQGQANFERYLQETPNTPLSIVVDVIEEEYRQDTIPHVFGSDRRAIIERKQLRLFRNSTYCHADIQDREETGRKDDNVLFMSLSNPGVIRPWLRLVEKYKVPLAGIYSLTSVISSVLETLPVQPVNALVVSLQSISGLRQTYFYKKKLRVSRLAKMPRFGTSPYPAKIASEVEKIHRYMNSMRLVSHDEPLDIYFLANGELLDELKSLQTDSAMIRHHMLNIDILARADGMKRTQITPFCDQFFMHHFLKRNMPNCYASGTETRYYQMRRIRHVLNSISMAMLLGGAVYSGMNLMEIVTLKQESDASEQKASFYTTRYEIARERLPKTPVEAADLKTAVELARTLKEYKATPLKMLGVLSKGLDVFPGIKLDSIEWTSSVDPDAISDQASATADKASGNTDIQAAGSYKYYQIGVIKAHLEPFDGNYREAIGTVNEFAETLRNNKVVYDLSIVSFPLDISSDASLQGNTRTIGKEARFTLRAVIGVADETG